MSRIAAIIHPLSTQPSELVGRIDSVYPEKSLQSFRHKNLELAAWDTEIAFNSGKTICGAIDGYLYEVDELRLTLKKEFGFKFTQMTDSELIVYAYDAWKENFLKHLSGSFTLVIFDEEKEALTIARDRIGQKPLYWTSQGGFWIFSSDIKGMLASGIISQSPSVEGLASYMFFGFIPQDLTPIQEVNKLLPGHFLKVNLQRQVIIDQYWSLSALLERPSDLVEEEVLHNFGKLLETAVRIGIPKERKLATYMMGNLGSASLAWFLSHLAERENVNAYTAFFKEQAISLEASQAKNAATMLKIKHRMHEISPESVLKELPKIIWNLDEPIADIYSIQSWELAKMASADCGVACLDLGWEEMLAGHTRYFYTSHYPPSLAFQLAKFPKILRKYLLMPLIRLFKRSFELKILRNMNLDADELSYFINSALFEKKSRLKASPALYPFFDPEVFTQRFHRLTSVSGDINPSLYYDAKTALPDKFLLQHAKICSHFNMKLHTPYLYTPLVEFLATIPEKLKFPENHPGSLLQHLMKKICHECPQFTEPSPSFLDEWRKNRDFKDIFLKLQNGKLVDQGLISGKWIRQQLGYKDLSSRSFKQLWSILVLEIWFTMFITQPIEDKSGELPIEYFLK